jgi:hypothetical protein
MSFKSTNPFLSNPYGANPYLPRMPMPNFAGPIQTPEQYKAELLRQIQPNLDMYKQQYSAYQQQQTMMNNSGQYIKVATYDEVKQVQAPSDGRPIIIIDDTNGFLYSKKFENGQEYIKAFRLVPNEAKEETPKEEPVSDPGEKPEESIDLKELLKRIEKLEGKNNGVSGHTDETTPSAEPTGV